jgi:Tfp pilus assembly protein PilN|tara:strand:+ start:1430 stop:2035 length:606 start_codon:yes stop_codon:yes gene_type:complete
MNKFIFINLNQTVSRAELSAIKEEKQRWILFGSIAFIFTLLLGWFISINLSLSKLIESRENTITDIIEKTNTLKKDGQINLAKSDIESLYTIEEERIIWSKKLKELARVIPDDMTIINVHYKQKRLVVSAIARLYPDVKAFTIIEKFIDVLESNPEFSNDFSSTELKRSQLDKSQGQEFLFFEIELKLNKKTKKSKKNKRT